MAARDPDDRVARTANECAMAAAMPLRRSNVAARIDPVMSAL
jgi:hypothetical protein